MARFILSTNVPTLYDGCHVVRPGLGNITFANKGDAWLYCWRTYGLGNFIVLK